MKNTEIIEQIRTGNHRHVHRLYNHFPKIRKWLMKSGCERNQTRDIFQEALLLFCLKCRKPDFELTASIETYLFSVCKFMYYNQARKDAKFISDVDPEMLQEITAEYEDHVKKERRLAYAFMALEAISERCREVLKLFYIGKQSMADIALKLNYRNEAVAKNQKYKCLNLAKEKTMEFSKTLNA
ncbi:MAG: sigma-70 family RNA polymerase sigma factor [Bacteroidetes bacterium]|nr:sigma-70 family RNA polymerase sigma factor [Bacteroidota bacterium]